MKKKTKQVKKKSNVKKLTTDNKLNISKQLPQVVIVDAKLPEEPHLPPDIPTDDKLTLQKRARRGMRSRAKGKSPKLYFHSGTQDAIVAYQKTDDRKEKERLYVTDIMPAFEKLVENLINIHKFSSLHDSYDDLKNDCVNFLFETIGKFDSTRGTNAFSYFNVVSKNWLIIRTKQKSQRIKRNVSLDDPESLSMADQRIIEDHCTLPSQEIMLENRITAQNINELLYDIRSKVKTENELACINSIITIFENQNNVDLINKSAILVYMRELSGLTSKQLTTSLQNIKKLYRRLKIDPKFDFF